MPRLASSGGAVPAPGAKGLVSGFTRGYRKFSKFIDSIHKLAIIKVERLVSGAMTVVIQLWQVIFSSAGSLCPSFSSSSLPVIIARNQKMLATNRNFNKIRLVGLCNNDYFQQFDWELHLVA